MINTFFKYFSDCPWLTLFGAEGVNVKITSIKSVCTGGIYIKYFYIKSIFAKSICIINASINNTYAGGIYIEDAYAGVRNLIS